MKFHSKVDTWFAATIVLSVAVTLFATYSVAASGAGAGVLGTAILVGLGAAVVLPLWLSFPTDYLVHDGSLLIRSGPLRWRVPVAEMRVSFQPGRCCRVRRFLWIVCWLSMALARLCWFRRAIKRDSCAPLPGRRARLSESSWPHLLNTFRPAHTGVIRIQAVWPSLLPIQLFGGSATTRRWSESRQRMTWQIGANFFNATELTMNKPSRYSSSVGAYDRLPCKPHWCRQPSSRWLPPRGSPRTRSMFLSASSSISQ